MAQAIRDMLRICAESGGVDETTGLLKEPLIKLPNTKYVRVEEPSFAVFRMPLCPVCVKTSYRPSDPSSCRSRRCRDDVKRAVQKARDAIVCSLQRRGEEEKKFEDNEHLEADDYEVTYTNPALLSSSHLTKPKVVQ